MQKLVTISNNESVTTSKIVADVFGKTHRNTLRAIENLECSEEFRSANFDASYYETSQGKKLPCMLITRDGFSFLGMGFTGKQAAQWKEKYILAFKAMESKLSGEGNDKLQWEQARLQIKQTRKSVTDTIKVFVEYATNQGSKSAKMYYMNITKMEYAALEMTQAFKHAKDNFRDTLDMMQLSFLTTAEYIARNAIKDGMERELPYKEIYKLAKEKVMDYSKTVSLPRLKEVE